MMDYERGAQPFMDGSVQLYIIMSCVFMKFSDTIFVLCHSLFGVKETYGCGLSWWIVYGTRA